MAEQSHHPQARRTFIGLAAAAVLGLALAGCQMVPKPRPAPVPERPPEPAQPTPGLPTDTNRNRVAVLVPLTGENGGVGKSISNAANLALLDAGGEGIRITIYDTAKAGAQAAANEALADGNRLFLGPLLAEDVTAVAPLARKANVPVIAFSNDTSIAGNGVYVMGFDPEQSVGRVVTYARGKGVERFAGLVPDGVYGRRVGQALIGAVEKAGGRMVAMQNYDRTPKGLNSAVNRLNDQSGYDAVLIADTGKSAAGVAPLIRKGSSADAKILGTELWKMESGLGATAALRGAWFAGVSDDMFNQLRTRYRARYGVNPYRLGSLGYDAVLLTVRIGRNWRVGRAFPAADLMDPEGFVGVDGAFRFRRDGVAERSLEVLQIGQGGVTTVSPAPRGFGGGAGKRR
ncbi:penicillin-binding protein activator [Sphingomonas sp. LY54]|uniref:penicillin-binding protein activator n=1 Tax=Sphingomonas sp. LY54 TaxID=3095343 RepID=UPI002D79C5F2|nr:penicillin-binding protein activator [Sphingomonas sp. LY54]WRP29182.1 penicillin-binding protein activator [Sphingomonas sp. LY54]